MIKEVKASLKKLGVVGKVTIKKYDSFTIIVYVNGKQYGLWDVNKKTFVD